MPVIPLSERDYAHPELIVDTEWLADHADDPQLRLVDARPAAAYDAGHIAGAASLGAFGGIPRAANGDMGSPSDFSTLASALGINDDSTVVVYDAPSQAMGMMAWAFMYYGHPDVRILDGGFAKWMGEQRPVSTTRGVYPPAHFEARTHDGMYCSLEQAKAVPAHEEAVFWDTRTAAEFEGAATAGGASLPRRGHLPGARNLEWTELFDPETQTLKPGAVLRALLATHGITPDHEVNAYCQGGARAAMGIVVLKILGYDRARTYAGSFGQWSKESDTPIEQSVS